MRKGKQRFFPLVKIFIIDNILHETIVPARISESARRTAIEIAKKLAQNFQLVGTLAVEMFLTNEGDLYE